MNQVKSIATHFRLIFTAFTLLCALALNNRELTTYALPANTPTQEQAVQQKEQQQTEVKQKISFEATSSFVQLQLDQFVSQEPLTLIPAVSGLLPQILHTPKACVSFFSRYALCQIMPNAP